jgi:hypothetical protein
MSSDTGGSGKGGYVVVLVLVSALVRLEGCDVVTVMLLLPTTLAALLAAMSLLSC